MNESHEPHLTQADLDQFTGDLERYRHFLNRNVIYTPGIKFLADCGCAWWLVDAITSYFGSRKMTIAMAKDDRLRELQFWHLKVHDDKSAILTMRADSGEKPAITQKVPFTDFPLEYVDVWAGFDGTHWTLYLPSEH